MPALKGYGGISGATPNARKKVQTKASARAASEMLQPRGGPRAMGGGMSMAPQTRERENVSRSRRRARPGASILSVMTGY